MLTLFPTPANESQKLELQKSKSQKPKPSRTPSRLQYLPVTMLVIAGALELAAWHRSVAGHAAPSPSPAHLQPAKFSAGLPMPPAKAAAIPKPAVAVPAKPPTRRELEKIRAAKARALETWTNAQFGITLSYPRSYAFSEAGAIADDPNPLLEQRADGSPAQQLLARIELPDTLYPRSDFLAGYLSLSVNPALSAEQCGRVIGSEGGGEVSAVEMNGLAWRRVEMAGMIDGTETTWREYSAYAGSVCYEVELGVVTVNDGTLTPANPQLVFGRLEKVLQALKIKPPLATAAAQ